MNFNSFKAKVNKTNLLISIYLKHSSFFPIQHAKEQIHACERGVKVTLSTNYETTESHRFMENYTLKPVCLKLVHNWDIT